MARQSEAIGQGEEQSSKVFSPGDVAEPEGQDQGIRLYWRYRTDSLTHHWTNCGTCKSAQVDNTDMLPQS